MFQKLGAKPEDLGPVTATSPVSARAVSAEPRRPELLTVLTHNRGGRLEAYADGAALVNVGAFAGNPPHDIFGGQYRRHPATTFATQPAPGLKTFFDGERAAFALLRRDTRIDIWRAAQLMLKRYGEKALEESAARAEELARAGDEDGAAVWRRITAAVSQLANTIPPSQVD